MSIHHDLFRGLSKVTKDGTTNYHLSRIKCSYCELSPLSKNKEGLPVADREDINFIATRLSSSAQPAGSWAFVAEQRNWFIRQITSAFEARCQHGHGDSPFTIVHFGTASYVHYFSTMAQIVRAKRHAIQSGKGVVVPDKIRSIVIDNARFPLDQIREVRRLVMEGEEIPKAITLGGREAIVSDDVREMMRRLQSEFRQIDHYTAHLNLGEEIREATLKELGMADVVSEHFLLSCIQPILVNGVAQINAECISTIRRNAYRMLKNSGSLLCAIGFAPNSPESALHLEILKAAQLRVESHSLAWDPYGMSRDAWLDLKNSGSSAVMWNENQLLRITRDVG